MPLDKQGMNETAQRRSRVDWFRVFADLRRNGWTLPNISAQTGVPRETLRDWANKGHEPKHCDGEIMVEFYCWATGMERGGIPLQDRTASAARAAAR